MKRNLYLLYYSSTLRLETNEKRESGHLFISYSKKFFTTFLNWLPLCVQSVFASFSFSTRISNRSVVHRSCSLFIYLFCVFSPIILFLHFLCRFEKRSRKSTLELKMCSQHAYFVEILMLRYGEFRHKDAFIILKRVIFHMQIYSAGNEKFGIRSTFRQ